MSEGPCCTCPQPQCLRAGERPAYFQSQEETNTLKQMRRVALHREPRSLAICKHEACPLPREGGCSPRSVHSRSARATAKGWRGRQRGLGDSGLCSGDTRGQATGGGGTHTCRVAHPTPVAKCAGSGLPPLSHPLTEQRQLEGHLQRASLGRRAPAPLPHPAAPPRSSSQRGAQGCLSVYLSAPRPVRSPEDAALGLAHTGPQDTCGG